MLPPSLRQLLSSCLLLALVHLVVAEKDYYVYCQRWPTTLCSFASCPLYPKAAKDFAIHGLWPSIFKHGSPQHCHRESRFDPDRLAPIMDEMLTSWPDLMSSGHSYSFWKHEWDKHGCCAFDQTEVPDELAYFKKALSLKDQVNLFKHLETVSISPNDETRYKKGEALEQLRAQYGVAPQLYCLKHHGEPAKLFEVRFCYDLSYNLITCPPHHRESERGTPVPNYSTMPCPDEFIFPSSRSS